MMKAKLILTTCWLGVVAVGTLVAAEPTPALPASATLPGHRCQQCPQEEIVYQDVVTHRCKLVPDKKPIKKTVYACKEVPFCLPKLPPLFSHPKHDCCEDCPECDCPRYKKVLLKKEITCGETCTYKCVVEDVIERVPCRVCRPCPHCGCAGSCVPVAPSEAPAAAEAEPAVPPAPASVQVSDSPS